MASFQSHAGAAAYEGVIRRLREKNVEVCLVSYPVSAHYATLSRAIPTFGQAHAYFDALARRHGVVRVNLFYDYARYDDFALFSATDHLNTRGAERFSATILARCFATASGDRTR